MTRPLIKGKAGLQDILGIEVDRLYDCLDGGGETELASRVALRVPTWPISLGLLLGNQMPLLPRHSH